MGRAAKRRTVPRQMPSPQVITIINSLTEPSALPPPEIRVEEAEKARRKYFSKVTLSHREKSDAPEHSDRPPRRSEDILRGASGGYSVKAAISRDLGSNVTLHILWKKQYSRASYHCSKYGRRNRTVSPTSI